LDSKQKLEVYKKLLNVTDIDKFDKRAFVESLNMSPSSLGGMISQMKNSSSRY
jgi:hypothetical protein